MQSTGQLWVATCLLMQSAIFCSAQAQTAAPMPKSVAVTSDRKIFLALQLVLKSIKATGAAETCLKDAKVCSIKMRLVPDPEDPDQKRQFCVAEAPLVQVETTGSASSRKVVVWTLDQQVLGVGKVDFFSDQGIIVVANAGSNHVEKGGAGDPSDPNAKVSYHMKVLVDAQAKESIYLPVIVWVGPNGPELCAAVDPKIVNV